MLIQRVSRARVDSGARVAIEGEVRIGKFCLCRGNFCDWYVLTIVVVAVQLSWRRTAKWSGSGYPMSVVTRWQPPPVSCSPCAFTLFFDRFSAL